VADRRLFHLIDCTQLATPSKAEAGLAQEINAAIIRANRPYASRAAAACGRLHGGNE